MSFQWIVSIYRSILHDASVHPSIHKSICASTSPQLWGQMSMVLVLLKRHYEDPPVTRKHHWPTWPRIFLQSSLFSYFKICSKRFHLSYNFGRFSFCLSFCLFVSYFENFFSTLRQIYQRLCLSVRSSMHPSPYIFGLTWPLVDTLWGRLAMHLFLDPCICSWISQKVKKDLICFFCFCFI